MSINPNPVIDCTMDPRIANQATSSRVKNKWSSLFTSLLRNTGEFSPTSFDTDGAMVAPDEVLQAGIDYWSNYLVGFFLDSNPTILRCSITLSSCLEPWRKSKVSLC